MAVGGFDGDEVAAMGRSRARARCAHATAGTPGLRPGQKAGSWSMQRPCACVRGVLTARTARVAPVGLRRSGDGQEGGAGTCGCGGSCARQLGEFQCRSGVAMRARGTVIPGLRRRRGGEEGYGGAAARRPGRRSMRVKTQARGQGQGVPLWLAGVGAKLAGCWRPSPAAVRVRLHAEVAWPRRTGGKVKVGLDRGCTRAGTRLPKAAAWPGSWCRGPVSRCCDDRRDGDGLRADYGGNRKQGSRVQQAHQRVWGRGTRHRDGSVQAMAWPCSAARVRW